MVFKNFPLRMHRYAMEAAMAAMAAGKQGKFWKFHDRLFLEYNHLSDQKIKDIAKSLGLNMADFERQMKNPEIRAKIQKDILDGHQAAVTGKSINRSHLKNVFSSDICVEPSSQVLDIL